MAENKPKVLQKVDALSLEVQGVGNQISGLPQKDVWTDARGAKLDNLDQSLSSTNTNVNSHVTATGRVTDTNVNRVGDYVAKVVSDNHASTKTHVTTAVNALPQKSVWTDARGAKLDNLNQSLSTTQTNIISAINGSSNKVLSSVENLVFSNGGNNRESILKSYTNAKGGIVQLLLNIAGSAGYNLELQLTVDNILVMNWVPAGTIFASQCGDSSNVTILPFDIMFSNSFILKYKFVNTASGSFTSSLKYYLNK